MGFKLNLDVNDTDLRKFVKEQIQGAIVGISRDEIKSLVEEQMKKEIGRFPATINGILKEVITYALRYSGYLNNYSSVDDKLTKEVYALVEKTMTPVIEERIKNNAWIDLLIEKEVKEAVARRVDKLMTITK